MELTYHARAGLGALVGVKQNSNVTVDKTFWRSPQIRILQGYTVETRYLGENFITSYEDIQVSGG